jgi:hypothetical protein
MKVLAATLFAMAWWFRTVYRLLKHRRVKTIPALTRYFGMSTTDCTLHELVRILPID